MKKILSIAALFVLFAGMTPAQADEQCANDCLQNGYEAQFCQEKCADNANPITNQQSIRRVEPHCFADCTNSGHDDTYCNKACTY